MNNVFIHITFLLFPVFKLYLFIYSVQNSQDIISLGKLFDRIENQNRNLADLGVKKESCSSFLRHIILDRIPKYFILEFNIKCMIN